MNRGGFRGIGRWWLRAPQGVIMVIPASPSAGLTASLLLITPMCSALQRLSSVVDRPQYVKVLSIFEISINITSPFSQPPDSKEGYERMAFSVSLSYSSRF